MDLSDWEPIYRNIAKDIGLDMEFDLISGKILSGLLRKNGSISPSFRTIDEIGKKVRGGTCFIFGGGESLEGSIVHIKQLLRDVPTLEEDRPVLVAADGAASVLFKEGMIPDLVVTDLDGGIEDQVLCLDKGSIMILHGHGDNMDILRSVVPDLRGMVIGSTQCDPAGDEFLINFGGFTDGDRAALLCDHVGSDNIILVGFDLDSPSSKIMDGGKRRPISMSEKERKKEKLRIARDMLSMIDPSKVHFFHGHH